MKTIEVAHGSGGAKSQSLINEVFKKQFSNPILNAMDDAATIEGNLAFTTDSFVVDPIIFQGGDIGKLSICGTVNDLAMKGAVPLYLSASFIIGQGFEIDKLKKIVASMAKEAKMAGVKIVTGDTKVIDSKTPDTLFITTTGIGKIPKGINISAKNASDGDKIILSGTIADHGIAILNARNDFGFEGDIKSDCACLNHLVNGFISKDVKVLRDPTRGGIASTLNEIASSSKVGMVIEDSKIPMSPSTKKACSLLGLDPYHMPNEGKFIAIVKSSQADSILRKIKKNPLGKNAQIIGDVVRATLVGAPNVFVKTRVGGLRTLYMLEGEQLPRIC